MKYVLRSVSVGLLLAAHSFAVDYYVATNGSDSASGSLAQPFATIQHAVGVMSAGDTCYIRGGSYHETVSMAGINGSSGNPITLKNYNGETVTLDGRIAITSGWTQHSGNIYKTTLAEDVWQLWVDEQPQTLARFPNVEAWSDLLWKRVESRRVEASAGVNGTMVDDPNDGHADTLAAASVSFDDCVAVMNLRNWTTYARLVQNHTAGSDTFNYDLAATYSTSKRARYFLEGGLNAAELVMLDSAKEWAFDESSKTLYLWADDGQNPNGRTIMAKNQDFFFTGDQSTTFITLDGLKFLGTTASFSRSKSIVVQNCTFEYPSFSKRALGSIEGPEGGLMLGGTGGDPNQNCTVYNCEFRYVDGPAIYYKNGHFMTIENNFFYMVDYGCLNEGYTLNGNQGNGTVYRFNTIDTSGDSESCRMHMVDPLTYPLTAEWNYHTRCGLLQTDGSSLQIGPTSVNGSLIQYNWFIDNDRYGMRFDGTPNGGNDGTVFRNISRQSGNKGFRLKGDFHHVMNNVAVNVSGGLNVPIEKGGNANTETYNNAADALTDWPIPGTASANYNAQAEIKDMRDLLRDPDNLDFRPRADAVELIDQGDVIAGFTDTYNGAGPDIGAYEFDDTSYFIPGRRLPEASHPVPPNASATAKSDADLMWRLGKDALSYDVYFGTQSGNLTFQGNQSNNIFNPGALTEQQTYYWRVDTITPAGTITGEEWSFTVAEVIPTEIVTLNPVADSYAENTSSGQNFGTDTKLELRTIETGSITRHGYLKFDVSVSNTIVSAKLKLHAVDKITGGVAVQGVSNNSWSETGITWNNAPTIDGAVLDSTDTIDAGVWVELDVTGLITNNGTYTIGLIRGPKDSNRGLHSRESAFAPELIVEYASQAPNQPPAFTADPFSKVNADESVAYNGSIATDASDPESDSMTFSKVSGPDWLSVATNGTLSGTPGAGDVGLYPFTVQVAATGGSDTATLNITVVIAPPTTVGDISSSFDGGNMIINWIGEEGGTYALQYTTNLTAGTWSNVVEGVTGVGMINVTNDTMEAKAFYRVILQ